MANNLGDNWTARYKDILLNCVFFINHKYNDKTFCSSVKEQAKVILNKQILDHWTLRHLCLKTVVDNKHFFACATDRLKNLSKFDESTTKLSIKLYIHVFFSFQPEN